MTKKNKSSKSAASLRRKAEELLRANRTQTPAMAIEDVQALIHELSVYQVELEMQNDELHKSQVELTESRDQYSNLYDFAPNGYLTYNPDGKIQQVNLTACDMLGFNRQTLLRMNISNLVLPESQDCCFQHRQAVFSSKEKRTCELKMKTAEGKVLDVYLESVASGEGTARLCRTALIDLTGKRKMERQIRESEQRYRRLTEAVTDCVCTAEIEHGRIVDTTYGAGLEHVSGYTPEELKADGTLLASIIPPEDRDRIDGNTQKLFFGETPEPTEHRIIRKDGSIEWVIRYISPQYDMDGLLTAYDCLFRVITNRRVAEEALRRLNIDLRRTLRVRHSEITKGISLINLLTEAISNLNEGIMITECSDEKPTQRIAFANYALCRISGFTENELLGQSPRVVLRGGDTRDFLKWMDVREPSNIEMINSKKDGSSYYSEISLTPIFDSQGRRTHLVTIQRDISSRKLIEADLKNREERLRTILTTANDAIISIDRKCSIITVNPAAEQMFGCMEEQLLGQKLNKFIQDLGCDQTGHPTQLSSVNGEFVCCRKDGAILEVDMSISEVDHLGIYTAILRDVTGRKQAERRLLQISEEEKRELAQDLHDSVCQELRGIAYLGEALTEKLKQSSPDNVALAKRIASGVIKTMEGARKLSHSLDPIMIEGSRGLVVSLRHLADTTKSLFKIDCQFKSFDSPQLKNPEVPINLYRITQEAIHNAFRHGGATRITITLNRHDDQAILKILDNGSGLPEGQVKAPAGLGLRIMRNRITSLGGRITIRNRIPNGVEITCFAPCR